MNSWRSLLRVVFKAAILFALCNLIFVALNPDQRLIDALAGPPPKRVSCGSNVVELRRKQRCT